MTLEILSLNVCIVAYRLVLLTFCSGCLILNLKVPRAECAHHGRAQADGEQHARVEAAPQLRRQVRPDSTLAVSGTTQRNSSVVQCSAVRGRETNEKLLCRFGCAVR